MFDREPNIDIVFRNGLKDLEILPPADVWDNIPPVRIHRGNYNSALAVAAGMAVLVGLTFLASHFGRNNAAPDMNVQLRRIAQNNNTITGTGLRASSVASVAPSGLFVKERVSIPSYEEPITEIAGPSMPSLAMNSIETLQSESAAEKVEDQGDIVVVFPGTKFNLYSPGNELAFTQVQKNQQKKFALGASLSPAYGFTYSNNSPHVSELMSSEENLTSYSTGLTFAYSFSSRFSLQSGIGVSSIGQVISGVDVFAGLKRLYAVKGDYLFSVETASGPILTSNADIFLFDTQNRVGTSYHNGLDEISKYKLDYVSEGIHQVFRYLEVPLVLRYKVIDRKVDLNVSGGMAYGYLVSNTAFATDGSNTIEIGRTQGVNTHSLSSQVGMGMEYNISKRMSFNVEPVFKYYLTPFSNLTGTIARPYSFGVFSGFSFKF